jgi:uncharacterized damage-inducible protein DinB
MNKFRVAVAVLAGAAALAAADAAKSLDDTLRMTEREVVSLAEAMPAEKYGFAPKNGEFAGVRTFGMQMKHIAAVNYEIAAAILGEKNPIDPGKAENGPDSIASKEQIVRFLKDSFTYTHKALQSVTDAKLTSETKDPFGNGKVPLLRVVTVPAWHSFDHYGQAVVYARMCGVIPPASRPR